MACDRSALLPMTHKMDARLIWVNLFCLFQKTTFQGLSQEALQSCIQSLANAKEGITKRKVGINSKKKLRDFFLHVSFDWEI